MQAYTELIAPSTVTHAVSLSFLSATATNLVVAKTSLLQVFRLHEAVSSEEDGENKTKLLLIGEYPLAGTITSLAAVKAINSKSGGDALLIAFKDAKLSLVEWDPDNYRISTISIHYYEGENIIAEPFGPSLSEGETILTVDPSSRCAALKFGARHLAILPFRQNGDELGEAGDEDFDAELDVAPTSPVLKRVQSGLHEGDSEAKQTPYKSSFVLPLTALDPSLTHPVHISFLYEYREPTFGILSAAVQPSSTYLEQRKDVLSYTVFTLDLEQRASTNLISVQKLPSDLWKVVPLPLPIGGALLVGTNEFVHVDQSGRTNAVAVNEFAKQASAFNMAEQSTLSLKLEDCVIESLDPKNGDLLVILRDGSLAVLSFKISGRSVGGLSVTKVSSENGGFLVEAAPSCITPLQKGNLFVGSEDGDSTLLAWTKPTPTLSKKRSHAQMLGKDTTADDEAEDEDLDDDDLYATNAEPDKRRSSSSAMATDGAASYKFEIKDTLPSLGPINSVAFGHSPSQPKEKLELLAATGRGRASRLAFMSREIVPNVVDTNTFNGAKGIWSVCGKAKDAAEEDGHDNLLFVYDGTNTKVYDILLPNVDAGKTVYTERTDTEFESEGTTISVSTFGRGSRIVQVRRTELRSYSPSDLVLDQIILMEADAEDEAMEDGSDTELQIVHTSFCDPYLIVLRDNGSVVVLRINESGEIEQLDSDGAIRDRKWTNGCLYSGELTAGETVAFLLGEEGGLHVLSLPDFKPIYTVPTLSFLPAVLSHDAPPRRGARETLTEVLVADLGSEDAKQPYLILRSATDTLTLYEPWSDNVEQQWTDGLRFRKVPLTYNPKFDDSPSEDNDGRPQPLRAINIGGRSLVHVPGAESHFIVKEATSLPKILPLRSKNVSTLTPLHHQRCKNGFGVLDAEGELRKCQISPDTDFGSGWAVRRMPIGEEKEEIRYVAFHADKGMYVVASCKEVDFYFAEEDWRHQEQDDISLRPLIPQYTIYLLSAATHAVIHSIPMPYLETITSLKVMPLEVSEHTHEQRSVIVIGSSSQRGEDMPAKGALTVVDILSVVPEPGNPESGNKLHILSREEVKGAVTAVEAFPGGMVGTGQGQKIMIRGLKEDGSCLPVAFLDAQCHTTQLKSLARSGLWLAGDAWKGLWFGGFVEEPYRLSVLGKSRSLMEVVSAEFLPYDGQLFILIVDANTDLHVLQYDPENPNSLSGTRLLHKCSFHLGHFPSGMYLLPSTLSATSDQATITNGLSNHDPDNPEAQNNPESQPEQQQQPLYQILTTSLTGSLSLLTPLNEPTYRRLASLQTQLTSILEHAAGLNPRAYRMTEKDLAAAEGAVGGGGARGVIDGGVVQRVWELGATRRAEVLGRAGMGGWELRGDLEGLGGGGLGFL